MKIKKIKIFFKIILFIFIVNLQSCGLKVIDNHGQIIGKEVTLDLFKEGETTKKEISNILGTPSMKSSFDKEKSWFYISSEFQKFVFLDGKNTDQKILIFEFTDAGILNKKNILNKNDINNIDYETTVTDSRGREIIWYKQFFTNLNPDPFGSKRK